MKLRGNKQFVCLGDGEELPDRNAYQQDGILHCIPGAQTGRTVSNPILVPPWEDVL
jgi:hypothetical protein